MWQGVGRASYLGRWVKGGKDGYGLSRYPGGALFYKVKFWWCDTHVAVHPWRSVLVNTMYDIDG